MKKFLLPLALAGALTLTLLLGINFVLRPHVEREVLQSLQHISLSSGGQPYETSADQVTLAPFSRDLTIRGLTFRGHSPEGPLAYTVAEAHVRLPVRILLAFTPLRPLALPKEGLVPVAQNVDLRNVVLRTPQARGVLQHETIDVLRADAALAAEALAPAQIMDAADILYRMGADNLRARFITVEIPGSAGLTRMTIDTAELRRWQGGSMGAFDLSDLRLAVNGREALRLGRLKQRDIHLPHEDTLRRLMDVADKTGAGMDRALAALIPLTDSMLAANPPLLGGLRAADLDLSLGNKNIRVRQVRFRWLSTAPRHSLSQVEGLDLPEGTLELLTGLNLPATVADLSFESRKTGLHQSWEKASVRATGLGDLNCALTIHDAGQGASLLLQRYSGLSLTFTDAGLTSLLVRALAPESDEALATLNAALASPSLTTTPQNRNIGKALRTFFTRPGTLEVRTRTERPLGADDLLLASENPGAFFDVTATAGRLTIEEQLRGLPPSGQPAAGPSGL